MLEIQNIAEYISNISPIILSLGSIIGVLLLNKINNNNKILIVYIFLMFTLDRIAYYLYLNQGNNLILYPITTLIDLVFIYSYLKNKSIIIKFLFAIFICFTIYEFFSRNFKDYKELQVFSLTLNPIFLLITYIIQLIKKLINDELDFKNPVLYILPFYLTISALIYLPLNFLINYKDEAVYFIWITNTINISVFYFVIVLHLWKSGKTQKLLSFGF